MNFLLPVLAMSLCAVAVSAQSQEEAMRSAQSAMGGNCMMMQAAQFCPGAKMGSPAFSACMKENMPEISAACQAEAMGQAGAKTGKDNPCSEDAEQFCPGMLPGSTEFVGCMRSHMSELSSACQAWAKKSGHEKSRGRDTACTADAKKYCGKSGRSGMAVARCLMGRYDDLSAGCQAELKDSRDESTGECMTALEMLCPGAEPGSPEMTRCMMKHQGELPLSCSEKKKKNRKR